MNRNHPSHARARLHHDQGRRPPLQQNGELPPDEIPKGRSAATEQRLLLLIQRSVGPGASRVSLCSFFKKKFCNFQVSFWLFLRLHQPNYSTSRLPPPFPAPPFPRNQTTTTSNKQSTTLQPLPPMFQGRLHVLIRRRRSRSSPGPAPRPRAWPPTHRPSP